MLIVADAQGRTDGTAANFLQQIQTDIPIVLISRTPNFKFNTELKKLGRYILCCYSEYNWDFVFTKTHFWGWNTEEFPQFNDDEYKRFDDWVASNPPMVYLKRELLKEDVDNFVIPIDYPCWHDIAEVQTKEQFDNRPISSLFFWGRSHESRVRLHGEFWMNASRYGYSVCDNLYFFEKFMAEEQGKKVVSLWQPHYGRVDISVILAMNGLSKISVAMPGAGIKTFRHAESSSNAVMLKHRDNLAWSFDWDETNCIQCNDGDEIKIIQDQLQNENLYSIYLEGVNNCRKYHVKSYSDYLKQKIKRLLK